MPEDTAEIWLNVNLSGTGQLWLDDFSLELWTEGADELTTLTKPSASSSAASRRCSTSAYLLPPG